MFTPGAKLHGEVIQERAPGRRPDPLSDLPETSARATGELETPDSSTEMRDWTMRRQVPARSGYNTRLPGLGTPAASRGPAQAGTWLPRAIQPANGRRPQTAPPAVHIGTLDIRIEAPKQRAKSPPRQPVSFRGSGMVSRLYLRRE